MRGCVIRTVGNGGSRRHGRSGGVRKRCAIIGLALIFSSTLKLQGITARNFQGAIRRSDVIETGHIISIAGNGVARVHLIGFRAHIGDGTADGYATENVAIVQHDIVSRDGIIGCSIKSYRETGIFVLISIVCPFFAAGRNRHIHDRRNDHFNRLCALIAASVLHFHHNVNLYRVSSWSIFLTCFRILADENRCAATIGGFCNSQILKVRNRVFTIGHFSRLIGNGCNGRFRCIERPIHCNFYSICQMTCVFVNG